MLTKITKSLVDSLIPSTKDQFYWDPVTPGFGLKMTPTGRKVYILQYRLGGRGHPSQRYTLGPHGQLTPDLARKEAIRLNGKIASGLDPMAAVKQAKSALSFQKFSERYLSEYAIPHKKPSSVEQDQLNLDTHLLPALGSKAIEKITRGDVAQLHHRLKDKPVAANRTLALLTTMMNLAEEWEYRQSGSNPCRHVKRYKEIPRERFLSGEELARLGKALTQGEQEGTHGPFIVALFRLLVFTGARLSEIRTLKWEDVDLQARKLRLPDSKTGRKVIALNAPALAVLDGMPRITENPFVCCGNRKGRPLRTVHNAWRHLRDLAGLPGVRIHDLRHSFASVGAGTGMGLPIIGALLGHRQAQTTARYSHIHSDPLLEASESIGQRIQQMMHPASEQAPVVSMPTRSRKKG